MLKKIFNILIFSTLFTSGFSQTGGDNVYEFLNLTHSAYVSSVGGTNVSVYNNDLNLAWHNPGLLNSSMDKSIMLNYVNYFAGINYGMAMYSRSFGGIGNFGTGITYLNYGSFTEADESGNITGSFTASEYAFSIIYSRAIDTLFNIGANLKPILSHLEKYTSIGMALDLGASYHSRNNLFSAGITLRNIGLQLTSYAGEDKLPLPFEIQAGVSQRLAHAPFRFSLTLRHLEKFDLTHQYITPATTAETTRKNSDFGENLLRHMIFGIELIPHKNFFISGGYNYQRRSELKVESKVSTVGLSWGFGLKTSIIDVEFGRATYHLAGTSNHISLIFRPDMIYKRGS
ncbi:MAG TPA: type IX secretion system protein PorQ [Bacteroidales bacterium]|nr:type IX secretion system protein PorQ [Bacteroidales bacterium]